MTVSLVGAGPGDSGLITVKGAKRLAAADVVLYDSLISADILEMIPQTAERIDVGKSAGNHPVPQETINHLLLEKARLGYNVVRLKGGDPFVFGRGGEELVLLAEHGIAFEVVPGVSSAVAGPAYAGIPVSHRDYASSVHLITGHAKNNGDTGIDYRALVNGGGTLVFLMGVSTIKDICDGLIMAGMDTMMPAAIVENATVSQQRKILGTVASLSELALTHRVISPALIIIGAVCELSETFDWFSNLPLHGKTVVVPRVNSGHSKLVEQLGELGAMVRQIHGATLKPLPDTEHIQRVLSNLSEYHWLVFTSQYAVSVFFEKLIANRIDIRSLADLRFASVGRQTTRALSDAGIMVDYQPLEYNSIALANGLVDLISPNQRVLLIRARETTPALTEILSSHAIGFEELPVYQLEEAFTDRQAELTRFSGRSDFDCVAFTSSSAVSCFQRAYPASDYSTIQAVCIGSSTAAFAHRLKMQVHVSKEASIESLLAAIVEVVGN